MLGLENEVERRTLTYTMWNESVSGNGRQGWHPIRFKYADVDLQRVQKIKVHHILQNYLLVKFGMLNMDPSLRSLEHFIMSIKP